MCLGQFLLFKNEEGVLTLVDDMRSQDNEIL